MASYRYERDIKPEDLIQETPPPLTPAQQRANWWHYHWYYVVLIAAALLAVGYFVWNRVTEVQPDYTVAVVSRTTRTLLSSASWRPGWKPLPGT